MDRRAVNRIYGIEGIMPESAGRASTAEIWAGNSLCKTT